MPSSFSRPAIRRISARAQPRSEEHTSELQSHVNLVCRLLLEKKKQTEIYKQVILELLRVSIAVPRVSISTLLLASLSGPPTLLRAGLGLLELYRGRIPTGSVT